MFKPVGNRVIIEPAKQEETTLSGIVLPDSAREKPQEGIVVALGSKKNEKGEAIEFDVKLGDRIIFAKYTGSELKYDGKEYLVMREEDILAIVE